MGTIVFGHTYTGLRTVPVRWLQSPIVAEALLFLCGPDPSPVSWGLCSSISEVSLSLCFGCLASSSKISSVFHKKINIFKNACTFGSWPVAPHVPPISSMGLLPGSVSTPPLSHVPPSPVPTPAFPLRSS